MGPGLEDRKAVVLHSARKLKFPGELLRLSALELFPASVPECSPLPHTVVPAPGPASQVQLDCSAVREPRTVGGQRLCIARLLGTQLASAYQ